MEYIILIRKAKKGDGNAFSKLIKAYEKDLYRVSKAMVKNDDDALDCIQDTILKAYENIKKLEKEQYFKTWFIKILINRCNSLIAKRKKIVSYSEVFTEDEEDNITEKIEVKSAVEKLEDELKILVMLYYFEDMSIKDIGESLKIPEGTVKSRLSRARSYLKELLEDDKRSII
ncbi:RNA polymerase sigma factor [Clostridium scatologenes]|uniref:ECF subfamily RNA polymerase sigma-24 subunit n=1 Tax=Clostridium scatologenes TaxID=1548 RepID=A0A0E3JNY0_CLOSL|nr:sigma-70 family RNA polymerase sigma factor [Clostridium scatologenes]AKA69773.1 ECF subfamily RNA polymerase sigma-24 subunit [Clostridium scatologenes]